jgi:hypothetical protein
LIEPEARHAIDLWWHGWARAARGEPGVVLVPTQGIPLVPVFETQAEAMFVAAWNYRKVAPTWEGLVALGWTLRAVARREGR